jgi:hypothetical protein
MRRGGGGKRAREERGGKRREEEKGGRREEGGERREEERKEWGVGSGESGERKERGERRKRRKRRERRERREWRLRPAPSLIAAVPDVPCPVCRVGNGKLWSRSPQASPACRNAKTNQAKERKRERA